MTQKPVFLVLTDDDCDGVLARNHVGRLAFLREGIVDIEPLAYTFDDDWLFLRSAYGTKLEALSHNPYVAFQVDDIDGPLDWESVVVHGTVYALDEAGGPVERAAYARAVEAIREVAPNSLTKRDPTPARQIVYGVHIDRRDGRMARSSALAPRRKRQPVRRTPQRRGTPDAS